MHIRMRVLLTPGNTTPIAIRNPERSRKPKEKVCILEDNAKEFSKYTKKQPIKKAKKANKR